MGRGQRRCLHPATPRAVRRGPAADFSSGFWSCMGLFSLPWLSDCRSGRSCLGNKFSTLLTSQISEQPGWQPCEAGKVRAGSAGWIAGSHFPPFSRNISFTAWVPEDAFSCWDIHRRQREKKNRRTLPICVLHIEMLMVMFPTAPMAQQCRARS